MFPAAPLAPMLRRILKHCSCCHPEGSRDVVIFRTIANAHEAHHENVIQTVDSIDYSGDDRLRCRALWIWVSRLLWPGLLWRPACRDRGARTGRRSAPLT